MRRRTHVMRAALFGCVVGGCATPPPEPPAAPAVTAPSPEAPSMASEAEQVLRGRAETYTQQRRWADALVQWELLALLRPDAQDYREQSEDIRRRINETAEKFLALAEQARRSGNLDRAVIEYLRVLNADRNNTRAAQGLREIERERTRRSFFNRPPRTVM